MTSHNSGQGRNSSRSAEIDLRWKAAGGWENSVRLQYSEGIYSSPCSQTQRRYADLRQDLDRKDNHPGGRGK